MPPFKCPSPILHLVLRIPASFCTPHLYLLAIITTTSHNGEDSFCVVHVHSIGRITGSRVQPIGSVQGCSAADLPCKQITHSCLVLGVKLTAHESRAVLRERHFALVSIRVIGQDAGNILLCTRVHVCPYKTRPPTAGGVLG